MMFDSIEDETVRTYEETRLENAALRAELVKWEADALRYCKNADYWRERAEKAEARIAALETVPQSVSIVQPDRLCSYFTSAICRVKGAEGLDDCAKCQWLNSLRNEHGWIVYPHGGGICPDCRVGFSVCQDRRHAPDCVRGGSE